MKNKEEMTIKEWITNDADLAASEVLAAALYEIYAGSYRVNGCPRLSQASFDFASLKRWRSTNGEYKTRI